MTRRDGETDSELQWKGERRRKDRDIQKQTERGEGSDETKSKATEEMARGNVIVRPAT